MEEKDNSSDSYSVASTYNSQRSLDITMVPIAQACPGELHRPDDRQLDSIVSKSLPALTLNLLCSMTA